MVTETTTRTWQSRCADCGRVHVFDAIEKLPNVRTFCPDCRGRRCCSSGLHNCGNCNQGAWYEFHGNAAGECLACGFAS